MTVPIVDFPDWQQPSGLPITILAGGFSDVIGANASAFAVVPADFQGGVGIYQGFVSDHVEMSVGPFLPDAGGAFMQLRQCNPLALHAGLWIPSTFYGNEVEVRFDNPESVQGDFALSVYKSQGATDDQLTPPWTADVQQVPALAMGANSADVMVPYASIYDRLTATLISTGAARLDAHWRSVARLPTVALVDDTQALITNVGAGRATVDVPTAGNGLALSVHNTGAGPVDATIVWRAYRLAS